MLKASQQVRLARTFSTWKGFERLHESSKLLFDAKKDKITQENNSQRNGRYSKTFLQGLLNEAMVQQQTAAKIADKVQAVYREENQGFNNVKRNTVFTEKISGRKW
jgi:hypothetical protein